MARYPTGVSRSFKPGFSTCRNTRCPASWVAHTPPTHSMSKRMAIAPPDRCDRQASACMEW